MWGILFCKFCAFWRECLQNSCERIGILIVMDMAEMIILFSSVISDNAYNNTDIQGQQLHILQSIAKHCIHINSNIMPLKCTFGWMTSSVDSKLPI